MKKSVLFLSIIAVACYVASCFNNHQPKDIAAEARKSVLQQVAAMERYITDSFLVAVKAKKDLKQLQHQFLQARTLYKKFEWAAEYFMPGTTRFVNGAALPEIEAEEHIVKEPEGLQVIEAMLFPEFDTASREELQRQLILLQSNCKRYTDYFNTIAFDEMQLWDASRLELFRVMTMGITGFDTPVAQTGINESGVALQSLHSMLSGYFSENGNGHRLDSLFQKAIQQLSESTSFNDFDRANFIVQFGNPLSVTLYHLQQEKNIPFVKDANRLLHADAMSLFDSAAFNRNAFVPDSTYYMNADKVELGRKLFEDPILSLNNQRSCASCHNPSMAYTDGMAKNKVLDGASTLLRNTPTLINAAMQAAQFYDLRATILENQAMTVISNKDEMHGNLDEAVDKLKKNEVYVEMFKKAFPAIGKSGDIKSVHITNALGSFIRSLTKLNSRFDQYMQGNNSTMNAEELRGFNLFMGKGKCATCHFMPLFNGTVPPGFRKTESEVIGVPATKEAKAIDADEGRYRITAVEPFMHAFKTTTVRNTSLTPPYMHNGVWWTLEEVIDFYDKGGGNELGYAVDNQTLPFDKLNLDPSEKKAIIAFIRALESK